MSKEQLPENDENTKYVPSSWEAEIPLSVLLGLAAESFPTAGPGQITISHEEIQVRNFGYDLYDSSDWCWYWFFER